MPVRSKVEFSESGEGEPALREEPSMGASDETLAAGGAGGGRTVFCVKFRKEMPGLTEPPWPGELGQRIYENVSAEAWDMWEDRMRMILNEYRIVPWQKDSQDLIAKLMEEFFFGKTDILPPDYTPQK
jgi:Fe-S cluster biosynthesis and repair protein YggX